MSDQQHYELGHHSIQLEALPTDGWILDIGGGGEGIIGHLMGKQVIAIDLRTDELDETDNDALKIVMDATDLKFLDSSFSMVTAFYSLMYMPIDVQEKVYAEVYRVLEPGGHFLLWDAFIPARPETDLDIAVITLTYELCGMTGQTGYGCRWPKSDLSLAHYNALGEKYGFTVLQQTDVDGKLFLEFEK